MVKIVSKKDKLILQSFKEKTKISVGDYSSGEGSE